MPTLQHQRLGSLWQTLQSWSFGNAGSLGLSVSDCDVFQSFRPNCTRRSWVWCRQLGEGLRNHPARAAVGGEAAAAAHPGEPRRMSVFPDESIVMNSPTLGENFDQSLHLIRHQRIEP